MVLNLIQKMILIMKVFLIICFMRNIIINYLFNNVEAISLLDNDNNQIEI